MTNTSSLPRCATIQGMGTWDDGLYDNDSALDTLGELVKLDDEEHDVARLVARIGLLAWMNPVGVAHDADDLQSRITGLMGGLELLPAETRSTLHTLLTDPAAVTRTGSRTPAVRSVLGGYCDGPRLDALLHFPGAEVALAEQAERAALMLDRALHDTRNLYELAGDLAALGVLIELQQAGLWAPEPTRLAAWHAGFVAIDQATKSERGFWWKYSRRVCRGFELLGLATAAAGVARASVRRPRAAAPPAPAGPTERFSHPTFGVGTLLVRSGAGDQETLELVFADGVVRKIRRRFVTTMAE